MKLFKKALAAVLAGVMALSMVACAPASNNTDDKKEEVVVNTAAADEILSWLNAGRVQNKKNEFGGYDEDAPEKAEEYLAKIGNDAALKKQAEIILDQIITDLTTTDIMQAGKVIGTLNNGVLTYKAGDFNKALLRANGDMLAAGAGVYYFTEGGYEQINTTINLAEVGYKLDADQKKDLKEAGEAFVVKGKADDCKVGIASKNIGSKTIVIMVASATAVDEL